MKIKLFGVLGTALILAGCTAGLRKQAQIRQEIFKILRQEESFRPAVVAFKGITVREAGGAEQVLDGGRTEPSESFVPVNSERIVIKKPENVAGFAKFSGFKKKQLAQVYGNNAEAGALFLKNVKTGAYARLTPEGSSVASYKISSDGKYLAYRDLTGLYLQSLVKMASRQTLISFSQPANLDQYGRYTADQPVNFKFSPTSGHLAYSDPSGGLLLLALGAPGTPAVSLPEEGLVSEPIIFGADGKTLYYLTQKAAARTTGALFKRVDNSPVKELHFYDIGKGRKVHVPTEALEEEMKRGRSLGTRLGQGALLALAGSRKKTLGREYLPCGVSPGGKYALFTIYAHIEIKTTRSSMQGDYIVTQTSSYQNMKPEKNVILDLETGEVRNLFGYGAEGAAILCPGFLPDGRIVYDAVISEAERSGGYAIYDIRPLSRVFGVEKGKEEKLVEGAKVSFSKKLAADLKGYIPAPKMSPDGTYLVWENGKKAWFAELPSGSPTEITDARAAQFSPDSGYLYYYLKDGGVFRKTLE